MIRTLLTALLVTTAAVPAFAQEAKPAFAEPSLSADGQTIAFVSGGDIWEVPAAGGVAHLLVTDAATEGRPRYSPDGTRLAFTSTRGGAANLYVLTLATGKVDRITWAEANEEFDGWSADGKWLYFASAVNDVGFSADIFRVAATGGNPLEVSREDFMHEFQGAPSPDGRTLALMARGLSDGQWWRNGHSHIDETELWTRPIAGDDSGYRKLLGDQAKHAWPMWSADGATLYFMSDKSGTENLWSMPASGGAATQLTRFSDGRVLFPALGGSSIVFERDFGIWRFDPATGQAAPVPITLRGAAAGAGVRHLDLSSYDEIAVSPDGQKLALVGHGEVFAVNAKDGGVAQRVTTTLGAESGIAWSADSRKLAYVSERGLDRVLVEYDVATARATDLTRGGYAAVPVYAPKGGAIVYAAGKDELRIVTPGGADRLLYKSSGLGVDWNSTAPVWSPDGKWIAFPVVDAKSFSNVWVAPAAGGEARPVSFLANGNLGKIAWSPDGKYILFDTSQRSETSRIVRIDLLPHVPKYREDAFRDLFKPGQPGDPKTPATKPDETAKAAPAKAKPLPKGKGAAPAATPATAIVFDGIRERATFLPIGLNAFAPSIASDGKTLVFAAHDREQDNLYSYDLDELAEEPPVAKQLTSSAKPKQGYALAGDGKTLFYLDGGRPMATPLEPGKAKPVAVQADLDVDFDAEKRIVFDDAWNTLNRNFYDPKFHGQDWTALRAKFAPYVAGARTPAELRRLTNLMIGELNASHSGINGPRNGPGAAVQRDRVGALGLRFDRAIYESGGGLVVDEVTGLGPAAVAGIRKGDRLTSVDGVAIAPNTNLDRLLENKVGRRTVLGVTGMAGAREIVLQPVTESTESGLAYRQWVAGRRALVDKLSGGKIGYVHIADMGDESLQQLYIDLDALNQAKQGVVIDIRDNNGGYVNGYALDVITRRNFLTMTPRDLPAFPSRQALGQRALGLPTVLVTNESSLSDAEDFTEGYRALGLGKVVGQPTAGWIIYTSGQQLIDGSTVRVPSIRIEDLRGQNMELNPRPVDVAVERPLGERATGQDAQLAAAVSLLLGR